MAKLVIKGHETRGKEVIEILEMLGGYNYYNLSGKNGIDTVFDPLLVPEPFVHNFVLSVASEKTYGACLTYYDPYPDAELPSRTAAAINDPRGAR